MNIHTNDIDEYIDGLFEIGYYDASSPFAPIIRNYIKRFYKEGRIELLPYEENVEHEIR